MTLESVNELLHGRGVVVRYGRQFVFAVSNHDNTGYIVTDSAGGFGLGNTPEVAISSCYGRPETCRLKDIISDYS